MAQRPASELGICPACGGNHLPEAQFCSHCGMRVTGASPAQETHSGMPPTERAPQHYRIPQPVADPLIGAIVAERYRILQPLGRGGMGVVYQVEHARIGKLMALKLLTGPLARDPEMAQRFQREALMASRLSHPNTVQVFDFGTSAGLTYLAMELVRGNDLAKVIEVEGPLDAVRTAKILVQICSSLGEAHDKDIVHRDLKPENIVLSRSPSGDDFVKVLDFGLAKLRESQDMSVTSRGNIVGTPYYMAPEQVRGEAVDQRSDIYALGSLIHVCLTRTPVFDAPSPVMILSKQLQELPSSPSLRFPALNIPKALDDIVMRCLAKDPAQRFQNVRDLQAALVESLRGAGQAGDASALLDSGRLLQMAKVDAEAATRDEVERYERGLKRRGRGALALLVVVVLALVGVGVRAFANYSEKPVFEGLETEPNDKASHANLVPFGKRVSGYLGKRLDAERSDRDFYRFDDVKGPMLSLEVTPIPNIPLCAWIYRDGSTSPLSRYCAGAAGRRISVPQLKLEAGAYLIVILQDRGAYTEAGKPFVYENVSDRYTLKFGPTKPQDNAEVEPNGQVELAQRLEAGDHVEGALGAMRDRDVYCANETRGRIRFEVSDQPGNRRPIHAVLQATPVGGPADEVPIRIHPKGTEKVQVSERDHVGQWSSPVVDLATTSKACMILELKPNPWAPTPHPVVAPASHHPYRLSVERVTD